VNFKEKIITTLLKIVMSTFIVVFAAGFVVEIIEGKSLFRVGFTGYITLHLLKMYIQDTMKLKEIADE
jgi:hypothetical protein